MKRINYFLKYHKRLLAGIMTIAMVITFMPGTMAFAEEEHSHTYTKVEAKDPTCEEAGNTEYYLCEDCGQYFDKSETTGEDGETEDVYTEIEEDSWVIEATGHKWSEPEYEWAENCQSVTYKKICENDSHHIYEALTKDVTYRVEKEATAEEEGLGVYEAKFNDGTVTTKEVTIPVLSATMSVSAPDVTKAYDGQACGIQVTVSEPAQGYMIRYGTSEGEYDSSSSPQYTVSGQYRVYYQVTAPDYETYTGSALIEITPKETATVVLGKQLNVSQLIGENNPNYEKMTLSDASKYKEYFKVNSKTGTISTKITSKVKINKSIPVLVTVDGKTYTVNVGIRIPAPKMAVKRRLVKVNGVYKTRYAFVYYTPGATKIQVRFQSNSSPRVNRTLDKYVKNNTSNTESYIHLTEEKMRSLGKQIMFRIVAFYGENMSEVLKVKK